MAGIENREDVRASSALENSFVLPWGQPADRQTSTAVLDVTPGEFVLRTLFSEFTVLAEKKIETILREPLERPLSKSLQRGEDAQFDQLLNSLHIVAEYSLPSLLKTLFKWYEKQQNKTDDSDSPDGHKGKVTITRPKGGSESPKLQSKFHGTKDHLTERRDLAVDFLFCLVLIEVLKQLPVHPVDDEYIQYILSLAFRHFKQRESYTASPAAANSEIIAALYAEVLGVLAHACFLPVRKRFIAEFKEHQNNPSSFVNIIYGMKYLRIKLFPVEELEEAFNFMRECAAMLIDSRDKEVKHAFALMFVEILLPVAAGANRELNVPALKGFVDMMYHHTFDLSKKTRHSQPIYPLVTVLLCVSQKAFFLGSWPGFLNMCLGTLKQKDVKMQKVAMECLYRLVWVYMVRIKGESNTATVGRLRSITDVLFPRGSRGVVPREAPLNYFVKIIQFIAQEKLDFAMNDIIFDLLSIGRTTRQISPERMNIGLRAFFVIADSLLRKGSEVPAMPTSTTPLPSGNTVRFRRVASMKNLTDSQASNIGLANYYHSIRKALDSIIRALDVQVGKPMMMSNHCSQKEHEEMTAGERKPKVDPKVELFRTCIAAIPRCIPEGMTKMELVDLLSRLTVHMDEELRGLALKSLQSFVLNFADWRESTILGFINVILREIQDNLPTLLDSALRMLLQLLGQWKTAISAGSGDVKSGQDIQLELSAHSLPHDKEVDRITVLRSVEGFALVMLCSIHPMIRKLALLVLKEVRILSSLMNLNEKEKAEKVVLDVIDQVFPTVLEKVLHSVPQSEKLFSGPLGNVDILVVNERLSGNMDKETGEQVNVSLHSFFWSSLMAGLLNKWYLPELCPSALQFSWPSVFNRLVTVYALIDSGASGIDSITSLSSVYSRGPKKTMNVNHVCLFRNYLIFACCAYPRSPPLRSDSPEQDGGASSEGSETKGDSRPPSPSMVDSLFRFAVPLLKSDVSDIREAVIVGLGRTSPCSYREFLDELNFLLREGLDRRAESVRRKRKRDVLRAYLVRIFELNAEHGCFSDSASELVTEDGLSSTFIDYIEGTRSYLESESEKDMPAVMQLRLHFAHFIYKMITSVPASLQGNLLPYDMRCSLFFLFSSWCAHFGVKAHGLEKTPLIPSAQSNDLELASLHAMCALLQCGPAFDPNGLATRGYLYNWLQRVLNSPKEKIHQLGHTTLVHLLENNANIPSLVNWVVDKCYTGARLVVSGCFKALVSVFTKSDYPCEMIPILNVVLFKTADSSLDIREKAAQLMQLLERRFFPFTSPSLSCTSRCAYSQCQRTLSQALATAHPEITIPMFEEMTARFETASPVGQRFILQYMLPWLANIELVDVSNSSPTPPELNIETDEEEQTGAVSPVELDGEGWGSIEATQLVLNNLFYITVKYDEQFSKEIEEAWASLCGRWVNNVHEILGYLIALTGIIGSSEVLVHAKKLAVYVARANQQKTIEELMEELKLTEAVASQFERCDEPPFFRPLQKSSTSRDSVSEVISGEGSGTLTQKSIAKQENSSKEDVKTEEEVSRKESKEERKESREERREAKDDSFPRGMEIVLPPEPMKSVETSVPLAEPEEVDQIEEEEKPEGAWAQEWIIMAHRLVGAGMTLPLPVPEGEKYFAPLPDILPFAPYVASLYRCNFALMLLAELVLDQASVDWAEHLPLMLHVIFLALDHGKALVFEHSKRLLINLIIMLVCRGDHVALAQSLFNFVTISELGLGKHGLLKSSWTLDVGNIVGVAGPSAGAGTGGESVDGNIVSAGTGRSETAAGGSSQDSSLPPEENSANRLIEQIQELIEFLANSECKPLWAFEDITPRTYKIKSAEQLELFVASVVQIFQASDSGTHVQEKMAKVALHWATSCSSRHYAGRSFQVFRALKVPFSWSMLSDVLSRLVESVGEGSEDVQGYVMEILLTLEAASDWTIVDQSTTGETKSGLELSLGFYLEDEKDDTVDDYNLQVASASPLSRVRHGGHIRSLSSGCELKRHSSLFNHFGRLNGSRDDPQLRARSVSVQCLKTPSEAINPQSQADMVTRVFWIAVSLLESDYEHEFLMAIHLLNKVLSVLDLSRHESRDKLDKILHRLKWSDFPGLQALLLKGVTNAATSEASLHLLAKLTVLSHVSLVDPSQASGFALNMLALLPRMLEHFDEPDEFSKTCAQNIVKVCHGSRHLAHLGKLYEMYMEKSYHRPRSTWLDSVCRYINDSFGHLTRSHITFLLEVLERGPSAYHQVVLGVVCALMRLGDFSSPTMRHFQNDALKTISKYLKGNLWKESLDILKLAVSHSSHLDTPPPRPASSVWTAHDSSWSAEAMMIKKDLPGRTLDFTFDLSATPVIGQKGTPEIPGEVVKENKVLSPVGTVDLSTWRKPHLSQRRTRERLVNVLTTCGHTVGLKQSPSVVFSSSSDLAVEKQATAQQPSSDEASLTEGLSNEGGKDELESQQISVLTNFDFLYDESEDVAWGPEYEDRRLSYGSLGVGSLERDLKSTLQTLECLSGSEPDLTPHDSSDDEDETPQSLASSTLTTVAASVAVLESSSESSANATITAIDSDKSPEQGGESRSPSVDSSDSLPGASDTSYSYKLFAVTEITWDSRDEPEKLWTAHVGSVVKDTTGVTAVNTFSLFSYLYNSTRRKFYSLTRECCNYLVEDKFRDVAHHFSNSLEFLVSRGECPFVCIDTETLNRTKLLERHKFCVLELHSHFANYLQKSERTLECLDDVKLLLKRSSVGSHNEESETRMTTESANQELRQVQLCRCMYKAHFQFLLFCSTYARLLESLVQAARQAEVNDLTQEVNEIRREVSSILEHPPTEDISSVQSCPENDSLTRDSAVHLLVDKLANREIESSVHLMRTFREKLGGETFGTSDEDNLDCLLSFYCKHVAEKNVGSLVMSGPLDNFATLCRDLMEVNVAILTAVEDLSA